MSKLLLLADASLPYLDSELFKNFAIKTYKSLIELKQELSNAAILLCRASLKVNKELLQHANNLQVVATASSGTDHIDYNYLKTRQIKLFAAHGANAHAVTDYVLACLASAIRAKNVKLKKIGIIGYGAVGSLLNSRLTQLGFETTIYDPFLDYKDYDSLFNCDAITVHANLHYEAPYPSFGLLSEDFFARLNSKTVVIQAARGEITNENALLNYLKINPNFIYCADVFCNEPNINVALVQQAFIATPHIAGHTVEAKYDAIYKIAHNLSNYFKLAYTANPIRQKHHFINLNTWENEILAYYDPLVETRLLQQSDAANIKNNFLALRKAHHIRHNLLLIK